MNKLRNVLFEELAQHSKADAQCEKTMMSAIGTKQLSDEVALLVKAVVRLICNTWY